jgi:hypothetical protein
MLASLFEDTVVAEAGAESSKVELLLLLLRGSVPVDC